jgi:LPPG:FO 2-phospho-L-lactate transferase
VATQVDRTTRLAAGESLAGICAHMAAKFGVAARILPMSDDPVRTVVETGERTLAFQEYFVREQCRPVVRDIRYEGAAAARPTRAVVEALSAPTLAGVVICPSNPWLSIEPILAVCGLRKALAEVRVPVVAVSPIIGGKAVKGPAAKIMAELGLDPGAGTIAWHYEGLIDGLVIDVADEALAGSMPMPAIVTNTMMRTLDDKVALARQCIAFCERLARGTARVDSVRPGR